MGELRWALIGLGLVFLAGLALWEWLRARRRPAGTTYPESQAVAEPPAWGRRVEPGLAELPEVRPSPGETAFDVPVLHAAAPLPIADESAVDVPGAAQEQTAEVRKLDDAWAAPAAPRDAPARPVRWPPARSERVLTLRIVSLAGEPFGGRQVRIALEAAGLAPGPQIIYHRADAEGGVIVSAAHLLKPGTLDPAQMDSQELRGLSLFSVLPGPLPPVRMLEELVAVARTLAHRLGAVVQDEKGEDLDGVRLTAIRRSLPDMVP